MSKIVLIHGMNQHRSGPNSIKAEVLPALQDGLIAALHRSKLDVAIPCETDVTVAFWGDLLRPEVAPDPDGSTSGPATERSRDKTGRSGDETRARQARERSRDTARRARGVTSARSEVTRDLGDLKRASAEPAEWEWDVLAMVLSEAEIESEASADSKREPRDRRRGVDASTRSGYSGRTPRWTQQMLQRLGKTRHFKGLYARYGELAIERFFQGFRHMHRYMHKADVFEAVQARVAACVTPETRVIVGHSLGSVIGFEALCNASRTMSGVVTFVTLGSPLGAQGLIYDHLLGDRRGGHFAAFSKPRMRPPVEHWFNIVDKGDLMAPEKRLEPLFVPAIKTRFVHNGHHSHGLVPYLTAWETGYAIASGLS